MSRQIKRTQSDRAEEELAVPTQQSRSTVRTLRPRPAAPPAPSVPAEEEYEERAPKRPKTNKGKEKEVTPGYKDPRWSTIKSAWNKKEGLPSASRIRGVVPYKGLMPYEPGFEGKSELEQWNMFSRYQGT